MKIPSHEIVPQFKFLGGQFDFLSAMGKGGPNLFQLLLLSFKKKIGSRPWGRGNNSITEVFHISQDADAMGV